MSLTRHLVLGAPLCADAGASALAIQGNGQAALGLHLVAVALAYMLARRCVAAPAQPAALTAALLVLALPLMGSAILAFVAFPTWSRGSTPAAPRLVEVALPDGSLEVEDAETLEQHGARLLTPIRHTLRDGSLPEERVRALMTLRHMDARRAVPLLRLAFTHQSEDVRLLAFAILEQREKRLRARIELGRSRLSSGEALSEARRLGLHRRLARDHWELVYAGFVSGDLEPVVLGQAREHASQVLEVTPDASLLLLSARIHLRQHEPERAWALLELGTRAGATPASAAPLFAEAAYQLRRFAHIPAILRGVPSAELRRPGLAPVAEFWLARGPEQ